MGGDEIDDDGDGVTECSQDCDDADALRFPGSAELCDGLDNDCDVLTEAVGGEVDADGDLVLSCEDCDDDPVTGPLVFPGATEICNSVDDDCDGTIDVGATDESTWYFDADGDTYGGFLLTQQACSAPTGYVASSNDCAELDANSYPGAPELCDAVDNDCNGQIDDGSGATGTLWYADSDADGYGDQGTSTTACSQPTGFVSNSLDCDDGNAATNPTSYEICDGVDNNCVGGIDEAGALNATNWYVDDDADGFGVPGTPVSSCTQPAGHADNTADCNDDPNNGGAAINPNASELCNSIDDDCDGTADDGAVDATIWYVDADGDDYGNLAAGSLSCTQIGGTVQDGTDCNDTEGTINPGAPELCDSVDNDCDGGTDEEEQTLGRDSACAGVTCKDILDTRVDSLADGTYWIDLDGAGGSNAVEVYCDMSGGGWTYESVGTPFRIDYTGAVITHTTPGTETEYEFSLYGASDGGGPGSSPQQGGEAFGNKVFNAGTEIHVYVGGQGDAGGNADAGPCSTRSGGFNGGGRGSQGGSGGGGATDIRTTLGSLNSRLLVAGGAGGCGYGGSPGCDFQGGDGGGLTGDAGSFSHTTGGSGGTQSAGGTSPHSSAANGSFGQGGNNAQCNDEGGGGGGWYGGAAGGLDNTTGGGGSSYVDGMDSNTGTTTGVNTGNGYAEYVFR